MASFKTRRRRVEATAPSERFSARIRVGQIHRRHAAFAKVTFDPVAVGEGRRKPRGDLGHRAKMDCLWGFGEVGRGHLATPLRASPPTRMARESTRSIPAAPPRSRRSSDASGGGPGEPGRGSCNRPNSPAIPGSHPHVAALNPSSTEDVKPFFGDTAWQAIRLTTFSGASSCFVRRLSSFPPS